MEMRRLPKIRLSKNFFVFMIFLIISTILWFLNALEKQYTTKIYIPIKFYNFPENKINISNVPKNLVISVKGYGYDILKFQLKKTLNSFDINVSKYELKKINRDTANYMFNTDQLIPEIEMYLLKNLTIEEVKPDTIFFNLTTTVTKKVKVLPNVKIIPQAQFIVSKKPVLTPDTVTLIAPKNIADSIFFLYTDYRQFENVSSNIKQYIPVVHPKNTQVSPEKVLLTVEVEKYTEKIFTIPIEVLHLPDSLRLILFPNKVKIIAKVALSQYDSVFADQFKAVIDYYDLKNNISDKLTVNVIQRPSNIYDYELKPQFVEYIIEEKND